MLQRWKAISAAGHVAVLPSHRQAGSFAGWSEIKHGPLLHVVAASLVTIPRLGVERVERDLCTLSLS